MRLMMLPTCFQGHGVFIYEASPTIEKFGSAGGLVKALQSAGMTHAWVRLHDYQMKPKPDAPTSTLVKTLRDTADVSGHSGRQDQFKAVSQRLTGLVLVATDRR
jgi:hypothetical protein